MTEVSSWSPTDASNNLTPPDGWPEGMQPSGVNDVGRMMMGALRRMYDTVTTGIANCLPLSGGALTGGLTVPVLISNGNISAVGDIGGRALYMSSDVNAVGDVHANSAVLNGGLIATLDVNARNISATSQISGNTVVANSISSYGDIGAAGNFNVAGNGGVNGTLTVTGGAALNGGLTTTSINAVNLNASSQVNTVTYFLSGTAFAQWGTDGAGARNVIFDGAGGSAILLYGPNGSYYRADNAHTFTNRAATVNLARFQADGVCQNASGSWSTFSDRALKENFAPYTAGLTEVLQLNPQSFTYIAGKNPFDIGAGTYYGLVAQDVEPILPEMVSHDDDGTALLQPTHLVYVLLNAVKELEARLSQLENRGG